MLNYNLISCISVPEQLSQSNYLPSSQRNHPKTTIPEQPSPIIPEKLFQSDRLKTIVLKLPFHSNCLPSSQSKYPRATVDAHNNQLCYKQLGVSNCNLILYITVPERPSHSNYLALSQKNHLKTTVQERPSPIISKKSSQINYSRANVQKQLSKSNRTIATVSYHLRKIFLEQPPQNNRLKATVLQ